LAKALFCLLLMPLALASSLPAFARAVAGAAPHVCHCAASHSECACPICHPDRDDLDDADEAIRGQCGDPDVVYGARLGIAVEAPLAALAPAPVAADRVAPPSVLSPKPRATSPPFRPPRA
jgi:hypothetical protein